MELNNKQKELKRLINTKINPGNIATGDLFCDNDTYYYVRFASESDTKCKVFKLHVGNVEKISPTEYIFKKDLEILEREVSFIWFKHLCKKYRDELSNALADKLDYLTKYEGMISIYDHVDDKFVALYVTEHSIAIWRNLEEHVLIKKLNACANPNYSSTYISSCINVLTEIISKL